MLCFLNWVLHCLLGRPKVPRFKKFCCKKGEVQYGCSQKKHRSASPFLQAEWPGLFGWNSLGFLTFQPLNLQELGGPSPEAQRGTCKSRKKKAPRLGAGISTPGTPSLTPSKWLLLSRSLQLGQCVLGRERKSLPGALCDILLKKGILPQVIPELLTLSCIQLLWEKAIVGSLM